MGELFIKIFLCERVKWEFPESVRSLLIVKMLYQATYTVHLEYKIKHILTYLNLGPHCRSEIENWKSSSWHSRWLKKQVINIWLDFSLLKLVYWQVKHTATSDKWIKLKWKTVVSEDGLIFERHESADNWCKKIADILQISLDFVEFQAEHNFILKLIITKK